MHVGVWIYIQITFTVLCKIGKWIVKVALISYLTLIYSN